MKKGLNELKQLMRINNTSKVVVEVMLFTDDTIVETPYFYLDTGQNIGEYIEGILGYSFIRDSVWLPVYSTLDTISEVCGLINVEYKKLFGTNDNLIDELLLEVQELGYELSI